MVWAVLIIFFLEMGLCPISLSAKPRNRPRAAEEKTAVVNSKAPADIAQAAEKSAVERPAKENPGITQEDGKEKSEGGELYKFEKPEVEEESYAWVIIKTLFILGLMVGGFYYFFRFVSRKAGIQLGGSEVAQVLSVVPLGQNKFIQIVDLAGRMLVLGVTDANINLIAEIKDKEEIDRIRVLGSRVAAAQPGGFQEFLADQIGRLIKKVRSGSHREEAKTFAPPEEEVNLERLEYIARQRERLKRMNGINDEE